MKNLPKNILLNETEEPQQAFTPEAKEKIKKCFLKVFNKYQIVPKKIEFLSDPDEDDPQPRFISYDEKTSLWGNYIDTLDVFIPKKVLFKRFPDAIFELLETFQKDVPDFYLSSITDGFTGSECKLNIIDKKTLKSSLNNFIQCSNVYGESSIDFEFTIIKRDTLEVPREELNTYLYHISPLTNELSIKKSGLVPKTRTVWGKTTQPARIYLVNHWTLQQKLMYGITSAQSVWENPLNKDKVRNLSPEYKSIPTFNMYRINPRKLPENIKFWADCEAKWLNNDRKARIPTAIYTEDPIPRQYIDNMGWRVSCPKNMQMPNFAIDFSVEKIIPKEANVRFW